MNHYDLVKYATHSMIAALAVSLYDVVIDGKSFTDNFVMDDAVTAAVSTLATSYTYDVVTGLLPYLNDNSSLSMLSRPLLSGLVYMMMYDYFMMNKYEY